MSGINPTDPWRAISPGKARQQHAGQRRVISVISAISAVLVFVGLTPFIWGWHQALFWGLILGGPGLGTALWFAARLAQRKHPLSFAVRLTARGVEGRWEGNPETVIPWSDIQRVVPHGGGFVVVGRGGKTVVFPEDLPGVKALYEDVRHGQYEAPPPVVETRFLGQPAPEPIQPGTERVMRQIALVRGPLGWTAVASLGAALLAGLVLDWPMVAVSCTGLCATLGGLWVALVPGLHSYLLGVSVVNTALVFQTTYRGRRGRLIAAGSIFTGLCFASVGALVMLAGLLGALG